MRIAINMLAAREGGSATYARALMEGFRRPRGHSLLVFLAPGMVEAFPHAPHIEVVSPAVCRARAGRLLYEHLFMTARARRWGADVLYCFSDVAPLLAPLPCIVANHNLEIYEPGAWKRGFLRRARLALLRRAGRRSLRRAAGVVSMTQAAAETLRRAAGVPLPRHAVVRHALPTFRSEAESAGSVALPAKPFILSVAGIYLYKNLPVLLDGFARFVKKTDAPHRLVLAGREFNRAHAAELRALARKLGVAERVVFAGAVARDALREYYQNAEMLVFSSKLETFGYPVLEAMGEGTPMILSDIPVFRETAVGAALYFDPQDADALVAVMERMASDAALRARLKEEGLERAASWTVENEADALVAHFERWLREARHD